MPLRACQCHGTGDECDVGATAVALLGDVESHLSAREIAYEPHRVDALVGWSGGDDDTLAAQWRCRLLAVEEPVEGVDDDAGLLHTPFPLESGGEESRFRLDDMVAVGAQGV